jgi:hypothetical protein
MLRGRRRRSPATSTKPRRGTTGIGHGAKSMRTSIVRLTAAPKGRGEVISDPADGLELAGGPERPYTLKESSEYKPAGRHRGVGPRGGALLAAHGCSLSRGAGRCCPGVWKDSRRWHVDGASCLVRGGNTQEKGRDGTVNSQDCICIRL